MKKASISLSAAVAATLAVSAVFADDTPTATNDAQADTATAESVDPQATMSGLRAVRDKKTGKLRAPNPNELREIEAAESADRAARGVSPAAASEPVVVRHASGMLSAKLGPEYLISLHGERTKEGAIEQSHPDTSEQADTNETVVGQDALPTE